MSSLRNRILSRFTFTSQIESSISFSKEIFGTILPFNCLMAMNRKSENKIVGRAFVLTALFFLAPAGSGFDWFGDSELTEFASQSKTGDQTEIDHFVWDEFLQENIRTENGISLLDYGNVTELAKNHLLRYVAVMETVQVTGLDPREQFAYWVNLYNVLTVLEIIKHYPIDSILDISYGLTSRGPWKEPLVTIEGRELSLDDIEHEILRPVYRDKRIHYAVNCASISCPNLQIRAFTRQNTETLLELGASDYINHPRAVTVQDNELILSSIYDWYADDFADDEAGLIAHLRQYAGADLQRQLETVEAVSDYRYDWALNE